MEERRLMNKKISLLVVLSVIFILSLTALNADENILNTPDNIELEMDLANASDMMGCTSIILQLEGNDSAVSFRRDAGYYADLTIEEQDWHGQKVLKQYKENGGYFVQVVITSDGWIVTYGGEDDGVDNEIIENITGEMVRNKEIDDDSLQKVQDIKSKYKIGHMVIKAPNGDYGVAFNNTHFKGHLNPNDYLSVPNRYKYFRNGSIDGEDPTQETIKLAMNDIFGLTRKNIMTYHYMKVENETPNHVAIDIFASNDDGAMWNQVNSTKADNFYYNGTFHSRDNIPIAPEKEYVGTHMFPIYGNNETADLVTPIVLFICLIACLYGLHRRDCFKKYRLLIRNLRKRR